MRDAFVMAFWGWSSGASWDGQEYILSDNEAKKRVEIFRTESLCLAAVLHLDLSQTKRNTLEFRRDFRAKHIRQEG